MEPSTITPPALTISPWERDPNNPENFIAYGQVPDEPPFKIESAGKTSQDMKLMYERTVKLMSAFQVIPADETRAAELKAAYQEAHGEASERILQEEPVAVKLEPEVPTQVEKDALPSKPSLVERIASDGHVRRKLSPIQKQAIRFCEAKGYTVYECRSCSDQPFFGSHSKTGTSCPWCGDQVKPHKHQCDDIKV